MFYKIKSWQQFICRTLGWTRSLLISVNVSVLVHMISTFHVVALSIFRNYTLIYINSTQQWFSYRVSKTQEKISTFMNSDDLEVFSLPCGNIRRRSHPLHAALLPVGHRPWLQTDHVPS
jgi:hypothetical protein